MSNKIDVELGTSDANIECDQSEACTIQCNGGSACASKILQCPKITYACSVDCIGVAACKETTIYCPDDSDCTVLCRGDSSCEDADIHWARRPNSINTLSCEGTGGCQEVQPPPINALSDYEEMNLECTVDKCIGKHINCPLWSPCHIRCYGKESCVGTTFGWQEHMKHSLQWLNELKGEL